MMCSYNIIWRVAQKRAWSKETITMSNMVFTNVNDKASSDPTSTTLSVPHRSRIQMLSHSVSGEANYEDIMKDDRINYSAETV